MTFSPILYAQLCELCRDAWRRNLLSGFNGNVSVRAGEHIAITRSGAAKGYLRERDVCIISATGAMVYKAEQGIKASSEGFMHVHVYAQRPDIQAIVHCHPRHLLALQLKLGSAWKKKFLQIPVFEAGLLRGHLGFVEDFAPGSVELAEAVGQCAVNHDAIWMSRHGITCVGRDCREALALAEELDHLAAIQLLSL